MLEEPQPGALRWQWTSWVFDGGLIGGHKERLKRVPEELREYVKERVTYLFSIATKKEK